MAHVSRRLVQILGLSMLVLVGASNLQAQSDRGTVTGEVIDPSGATIPGVSITATNVGTALGITVISSSSGNYTIPLLRPGIYDITAEKAGFKRYVRSGVVVEVGQILAIGIQMQIGERTERVEVTSEAPQIEKNSSDRGAVVNGRDVVELPILGQGEQRNPGFFMTLVPGVTGRGTSGGGSPRMLNTTVNGSQSASNEFQLDGALIGNAAEWAGDFRNIPFPQDAVAEFKVITLLPPAEFGRTGQGITSFTLRSGSNQLHGSAYELLRNEDLDAVPFFVNSGTNPGCHRDGTPIACRPVNKQNEFGATVGGPIRKDKTFFFGWYQGF